MEITILALALALPFYAAGIILSFFGTTRRTDRLHRTSAAVVAIAWMAHLIAVIARGWSMGKLPLSNLAEFFLVLGWVVISLHLFVWLRFKVDVAGLVLPPLGTLMAVVALGLLPGSRGPAPYSTSQGWFLVHTSASTLGLAALGIAFAMSLIYLLQDRALKSKRQHGLLERLPSLDTCDRIGHHAILWGFPLLTLGIVTGFVRNHVAHGQWWVASPKQVFPLLAWGFYAVLLYSRVVQGYHGRRSAYLIIAGFIAGLLTVFGIAR